jgi:DNA modification methylase
MGVLGNITIHNGDCLEVMKSIPDGSIDAIITDPPYGTTACKWDSVIPFDLMWEQLNRIIKPNGAIVLFGSEPFSSALRMSNIKNYKYDWIWDKVNSGNMLNCKKQPLRVVENISVFNSKIYNPIMIDDGIEKAKQRLSKKPKKQFKKTELTGDYRQKTRDEYTLESQRFSYPKNLLRYNKIANECNSRSRLHPTQKPLSLMEYLIRTYTNEGETVLDFTMGSGTTMVACQNTNRNGIGIELDKDYFEIAKKRIKEYQLRLF